MTHRIKTLIVSLLIFTSLTGLATASPAQDLFDQAAYLLKINYGGFSRLEPKTLEEQFQLELDKACAAQLENCPYTTAHPIIVRMVEALQDKHTNFVPAKELQVINSLIKNGATAEKDSEKSTGLFTVKANRSASRIVLEVFPDSPAAKAGLQRGDRIVAVNKQAVSRYGDQIESLLMTGNNQPVRLLILRAGKAITATLEPQVLAALPGPGLNIRADGIAVLRIPTFLLQNLGSQVQALVREAKTKNARGLILDLRDNGGGLANEYVQVVSAFINDPGRTFSSSGVLGDRHVQYRDGQVQSGTFTKTTDDTSGNPSLWTGPLVVLVNATSASASEFTAHDLQRYAKATVIGTQTYGVGNTVTSFLSLEDGSGLQITLSKALHPDGTPYPEYITPDQVVADDLEVINRTGRDAVLERALAILLK
jgi:carboxyl-terminal processing protease